MGYIRGFTGSISIDGQAIVTSGDVSVNIGANTTPIQTRAFDEERHIPGMATTEFSFTVYAGTDPDVQGCVDGFALCQTLALSKAAVDVAFSGGGVAVSKKCFVSSFQANAPVDGVVSAQVTMVRAGHDSGGGSGSGT